MPTFTLLVLNSYQQYTSQKKNARDNAVRLVKILKSAHVQTIEDEKSVLKAMAQLPSFRGREGQRCDFLRMDFTRVFPRYWNIMLANASGKTMCSTSPANELAYVGTRQFFQETIKS